MACWDTFCPKEKIQGAEQLGHEELREASLLPNHPAPLLLSLGTSHFRSSASLSLNPFICGSSRTKAAGARSAPANILFLAFCSAPTESASAQLMREKRKSGKCPFVSVACRAHPPHGRAAGCSLSIPELGMHQFPRQSSPGLGTISKLELHSSQASLCGLAALSLLAASHKHTNKRRKAVTISKGISEHCPAAGKQPQAPVATAPSC